MSTINEEITQSLKNTLGDLVYQNILLNTQLQYTREMYDGVQVELALMKEKVEDEVHPS